MPDGRDSLRKPDALRPPRTRSPSVPTVFTKGQMGLETPFLLYMLTHTALIYAENTDMRLIPVSPSAKAHSSLKLPRREDGESEEAYLERLGTTIEQNLIVSALAAR